MRITQFSIQQFSKIFAAGLTTVAVLAVNSATFLPNANASTGIKKAIQRLKDEIRPNQPAKAEVAGGFTWVNARNGHVPPGAVPAGEDVGGETLYACSIGSAVGKLVPSHRSCYVAYGHRSFPSQKYRVLTTDARWQWVPLTGDIPQGAVIGGQDGEPLYVCSAFHQGKQVPGKYPPSHNVCYITFGNRSIAISDFYVIVAK